MTPRCSSHLPIPILTLKSLESPAVEIVSVDQRAPGDGPEPSPASGPPPAFFRGPPYVAVTVQVPPNTRPGPFGSGCPG